MASKEFAVMSSVRKDLINDLGDALFKAYGIPLRSAPVYKGKAWRLYAVNVPGTPKADMIDFARRFMAKFTS